MSKFLSVIGTVVFALTAASSVANAASFDCKKAATYVEKEICSDALLGKLDDALSENYNAMLATDLGDGGKELKKTQRAWLVGRNKCTTNKCLIEAYRSRVDEVCDAPVVSGMHAICTQASDILEASNKSTGAAVKSSSTVTAEDAAKMVVSHQASGARSTDIPVIETWMKTCMPFTAPIDLEKQIRSGQVTFKGIKIMSAGSADGGSASVVSLTLAIDAATFKAEYPEFSKKIKLQKTQTCPIGGDRSLADQLINGEKGATIQCNCLGEGD